MRSAWRICSQRPVAIITAVVVIWLPCCLVSSWFDAFVFGEDDFARSFKLYRALENFIGIIAYAAVITIVLGAAVGVAISPGRALVSGIDTWFQMFWTRLLSGLAVLLGLIFLIIPGIYIGVRMCIIEAVVVSERISGVAAMKRSFELTVGQFWPLFWLMIVQVLVMVSAIVALMIPYVVLIIVRPELDHWLLDAAISLLIEIVFVYWLACFACAYMALMSRRAPHAINDVNEGKPGGF